MLGTPRRLAFNYPNTIVIEVYFERVNISWIFYAFLALGDSVNCSEAERDWLPIVLVSLYNWLLSNVFGKGPLQQEALMPKYKITKLLRCRMACCAQAIKITVAQHFETLCQFDSLSLSLSLSLCVCACVRVCVYVCVCVFYKDS